MSLSSSLLRFGDLKEEEVRRHEGASSDGYLAHVFRHAAKELFNEDVGEVTYRARRCVPACWGLCRLGAHSSVQRPFLCLFTRLLC